MVNALRTDSCIFTIFILNGLGEDFFKKRQDNAPNVLVTFFFHPVLPSVGGHFLSNGGLFKAFVIIRLTIGTNNGILRDFTGHPYGVGSSDDVTRADGGILSVRLVWLVLDQKLALSDHTLHQVVTHG